MNIIYGPGVSRNVDLPASAVWLANTPASHGHWYSRTVNRSAALQAIDRSILAFNQIPGLPGFVQMETAYAAWHQSKINCIGNFSSRRAPASNPLGQALATHRTWLNDSRTVMDRIEAGLLNDIPWKTDTLCAELYEHEQDPLWAPLQQRDVEVLAFEATLTSRWAMNAPLTVQAWDQVGAGELARLNAWDALPAGHPRYAMRQVMGIDANVPGQWPPWSNRPHPGPQVAFVRKGLFCHSYAALAANWIYHNIPALEAGTQYRIHSIDIIHQWNAPGSTMQHWWVCVNGPQQIQYALGNVKTFTAASRCLDYIQHLPFVGGFVVDIWRALWRDQRAHQHARAVSNAATAGDCVWQVPEMIFLGNTRVTKHARETWV